jgi:hypothetical protein
MPFHLFLSTAVTLFHISGASQVSLKRTRLSAHASSESGSGEAAASGDLAAETVYSHGLTFPIQVVTGYNITGLTARGRFIESYDMEKIAETYDADTATFMSSQLILDTRHDLFTPNTRANPPTELTPFGEVRIGRMYTETRDSVSFILPQVPDVVIKYQSNCLDIFANMQHNDTVVHPVVIDRWYSNEAFDHDLSFETIFVSPPAPLCDTKSVRCLFKNFEEDEFDECKEMGGSIRYLIMMKPQSGNIYDLRGMHAGVVPFHIAAALGHSLIEVLETLHRDAAVVHGEIGEASIVVNPIVGSESSYSLKLTNFGLSNRLSHDRPDRQKIVSEFETCRSFWLTQWQIDGYYSAARDDVMAAVQMIARIIHPLSDYVDIETFYEDGAIAGQLNFKKFENFFAPTVPWNQTKTLDVVGTLNVTDARKSAIREHLGNILRLVRGLDSTDTEIPYAALQAAFAACSELSSP